MANVLIVGATSAIAKAVARIYASKGDSLYLLARSENKLASMEQDLQVRGAAAISSWLFDACDLASHPGTLDKVFEQAGQLDVILVAHGSLPDQKKCEADMEMLQKELNINAISTISLLNYTASFLEGQGSGTLAAITSVAGDRGRQSNYIYGAAKAMISTCLQGLRNRLFDSGINVVDIKPGFVDTPMTESFDKGPLWATPETIASGIVAAIDKNRNTVYLPWFWYFVMFIIRNIPEFVFKRLKL